MALPRSVVAVLSALLFVVALVSLLSEDGAPQDAPATTNTDLRAKAPSTSMIWPFSRRRRTSPRVTTRSMGLAFDEAGGPIKGAKALPIPAGIYGKTCPFAEWYANQLPSHFSMWETLSLDKYFASWRKAGSPTGIRKNDHNYDTKLGQGNTIGFLLGSLSLSSNIPSSLKYGLFAKSGSQPAVVRVSDFGADNTPAKLSRMAVKVPLSGTWAGEANLLFTETMDSFPIANYDQLAAFAGDTAHAWYTRWWRSFKLGASGAWVLGVENILKLIPGLGMAFTEEPFAKPFYSQLPYALGRDSAMKFQLVPKQKTCKSGETGCCLPPAPGMPTSSAAQRSWATGRAAVLAKYLAKCNAAFDLQLQVKSVSKDRNTIMSDGAASWSETPITVGTLTIPKQPCTRDVCMSTKLQAVLGATTGIKDGIDKAFAFHPVMNHRDNMPVGEINTFRAAFYSQHNKKRFETIQKGIFSKDQKIDFDKL